MEEEKPSKESGKIPSEATRRRRARKWRKRETVAESCPEELKVESPLKPLEEKTVKEKVDDEGKEQPLTGQSPVTCSTSTTSQAEAVQLTPSAVLECGVLEGREQPAPTTSKSPLSASVSGGWETKEVDEGPLSEARADPMILAAAGDVSSEKSNKPLQHKKHKRHALTTENVLRVLKGLQWNRLCDDMLDINYFQQEKIEKEFASEDQRRTAAVNFYLHNHLYASWRHIISNLDYQGVHHKIQHYAEKLTDPTYTAENMSTVLVTVMNVEELREALVVPPRKLREIQQQSSTVAQQREALIIYHIKFTECASWTDLANSLYLRGHHDAVATAKTFIKQTPEPTLTLSNLTTLLENVNWFDVGLNLWIPYSKLSMIREQHHKSQCRQACWELYLNEVPFPCWKRVAVALYYRGHLEELEIVQRKYLKGTAEGRRQFEDAMRYGSVQSWLCKLLMYGAAGSGKTTTKDMIVGDEAATTRTSTPLAMRPTTVYRINLDGEEWAKLTTLNDRKAFLARALLAHNPRLVDYLIATRQRDTKPPSTGQFLVKIGNSKVIKSQTAPVIDQGDNTSSAPSKSGDTLSASVSHAVTASPLDSSDDSDAGECEDEAERILQSISTDEELVKLMDQLSTTVTPLTAFRIIQIIDSGGQPQFHEILPIFLRRLSYYLFVFRLCDNLDSRPVVEFYVDGKPIGTPYESAHTVEQLLQHCVRTMHSHRSSSGSAGEYPQIIVVGTHADREKESTENRDVKNEKIHKLLSHDLENQIVYYDLAENKVIFPLNALEPGNAEEVVIAKIREAFLDNASIQPDDIPLGWFALEILLEQMSQSLQRGVLSKDECLRLAMEKLHFKEDSLDAAIEYLDQISVLFYYRDILPSVVFADPQVILDKVTELVMKSFEICKLSKKHALSSDWKKFYQFALVTVEFLSQADFNKHYIPGVFEPRDLIHLFKRLLIFASFSSNELFVPALLNMLEDEKVDNFRVSFDAPIAPMVIKFPDGGPRRGIFCALTCFLASTDNDLQAPWTILVDKFRTPVCLYRNCIQYEVPRCPGVVTLIDTFSHFEVHIRISPEAPIEVCPNVCRRVYQALFKGLRKATLNLRYSNSVPSPALLCPCCIGNPHSATADTDDQLWICTLNKMKCGKLTSQQLLWLNCSERVKCALTDDKCLTESHLPQLELQLKDHACQWRDIGTYLGFRQGELDNIQSRAHLQQGAPLSYLRAMLSEWFQWAPGDSRGSTQSCKCTLKCLKLALQRCNLGQTAALLSI